MARIALEKYYKGFFKDYQSSHEEFREINKGHVISSNYYDVQYGRNSLIYRDISHNLAIPIEHDISHTIVVYLGYFFEHNECNIHMNSLKEKIGNALKFLNVKCQFEWQRYCYTQY